MVEFFSHLRRDCAARCDKLPEEPIQQREGDGGGNKGGERGHDQASVLVASINEIHGKVEQVAKKVEVGGRKRKKKDSSAVATRSFPGHSFDVRASRGSCKDGHDDERRNQDYRKGVTVDALANSGRMVL